MRIRHQPLQIALLVLCPLALYGQTEVGTEKRGSNREIRPVAPSQTFSRWGIGMSVLYEQTPYRGADDRIWPIPTVQYVGERLFIYGPRAG